MTPEMATLKARLRSTWMAGDYVHFATYLEPGALDYLARIIADIYLDQTYGNSTNKEGGNLLPGFNKGAS